LLREVRDVEKLPLFLATLVLWLLVASFMWLRSRRVPPNLVLRYRWAARFLFFVAALNAVIVILVAAGFRSIQS
jgi:hypothetical protein